MDPKVCKDVGYVATKNNVRENIGWTSMEINGKEENI